jgi:hypothetical protein
MRRAFLFLLCILLSACAPILSPAPALQAELLERAADVPERIVWASTDIPPIPDNETLAAESPGADQFEELNPPSQPEPTPLPAAAPTPWPGAQADPVPGLYYRWENSLWRVDASGQSEYLLDLSGADQVELGSDGTRALLTRGAEVFVVDFSTGTAAALQVEEGYTLACPGWWPNRPEIILALAVPEAEEASLHSGCQGRPAAFSVEGEFFRYLAQGRNEFGPLAPSADGKLIVFDQEGEAWIYRSGFGAKAFTPYSYNFPRITDASFFYPEFSPEGGRLAWLVQANVNGVWQTGLGVFRLDEKKSRLISPYPIRSVDGEMSRIYWSPDENTLALHNYAARQLWVVTLEGRQVYSSTALSSFQPVWSPDGHWLAYPEFSEQVGGFVLNLLPSTGAQAWEPHMIFSSCQELTRCECSRVRALVWHPYETRLVMAQEMLSADVVNWLIDPETGHSARLILPPGAVVLDWIVDPVE